MAEQAPVADGPSLQTSPTMLAILVGRQLQARVDAALQVHGVTLRHLGVLGHLQATPDLSYAELGRRSRISVQAVHRTVEQLIELGAVVAVVKPGEAAQLRVSDTGRQLLDAGRAAVRELDARLIGERGADLSALLLPLLRAMLETRAAP